MKVHYKSRATIAIVLLLGCSIVSAADFVSYEGKDSIHQGNGGEKKTVDGVDFWANGAPPRTFKVIGYITDSRLKTGLIGMIRMSGLESSIAKTAKKAGGDAVILSNSESETIDHINNSYTNSTVRANTTGNINATTSGNTSTGTYGAATTAQGQSFTTTDSVAVERQHTKYAVIKYLVDEPSAATDAQR